MRWASSIKRTLGTQTSSLGSIEWVTTGSHTGLLSLLVDVEARPSKFKRWDVTAFAVPPREIWIVSRRRLPLIFGVVPTKYCVICLLVLPFKFNSYDAGSSPAFQYETQGGFQLILLILTEEAPTIHACCNVGISFDEGMNNNNI
jgi:hypothetical protein